MVNDGGGFIAPSYICEDCFTPSDDGPCFDDLPVVAAVPTVDRLRAALEKAQHDICEMFCAHQSGAHCQACEDASGALVASCIVSATNSHDDMLAVLRWVRKNYASGSTQEINERIDAAIAKASA
jgi:hypothetical protein